MGYVLPWGQMSFWGATVITNLFSALPLVGNSIVHLAVGRLLGRQPDPQPLLRAALPAALRHRRAWSSLHIWALHIHGSNNPLGIDAKGPQDTIPFHPYYTVKDMFGLGVFLIFYSAVRVLRAELLRRAGQLYPGQSTGDAAAYRAGMVLPAVLRDLALDDLRYRYPLHGREHHQGEARRRDRHVRRHRPAVCVAVARHTPRALGASAPGGPWWPCSGTAR